MLKRQVRDEIVGAERWSPLANGRQVLSERQRRRPPGRHSCLRRSDRDPPGRADGGRASAHLWPRRNGFDPWHYVPVLARKPGALRNGAPFKDWVLPAGLDRVWRKLAGSNDGDRQMVKILAAVLADGLPGVEAACLQALSEGVHSADVVLNILARRRESGAGGDALRLRHAPVADCARYDQLRSA